MDCTDIQLGEQEIALLADSHALLQAVNHLERRIRSCASAEALPSSLVLIEESLHALGRCCRHAGDALIAPGDPRESLADRFARASAHWPAARGCPAPSRERQARILATLGDTRAALDSAGASCRSAHELMRTGVAGADRIGDDRRLLAAPA